MLRNVFYGCIKAVAAVLNKRPVNLLRQYLLRERFTGRFGLIQTGNRLLSQFAHGEADFVVRQVC